MNGEIRMRSYEAYKEKVLKDNPEVKAEYDALQPEFDIIQAAIDEKNEQNPADGENDGDEMSDLFSFLENFDTETYIKICGESGELIFDGKTGDVPQRVSNMMSVIRGSVVNKGDCLVFKVKKDNVQ